MQRFGTLADGGMTAPPKPPVDPVRWQPPPVDPLPDFGPAELTVIPVPGNAPEDVVVDADGNIWTGVDDGRIVRISPDGQTRCRRRHRWTTARAWPSPATAACWCATVRADCWRWTPPPASSRHWSTRSTGGTCSSARMSPKHPTAQSISPSRRARSPTSTSRARYSRRDAAAACSGAIPTAPC